MKKRTLTRNAQIRVLENKLARLKYEAEDEEQAVVDLIDSEFGDYDYELDGLDVENGKIRMLGLIIPNPDDDDTGETFYIKRSASGELYSSVTEWDDNKGTNNFKYRPSTADVFPVKSLGRLLKIFKSRLFD